MSKHTPAPWLLADGDKKFVYALNDKGINAFFAHVQDPHTSKEELEANARLIAAAPEMLDELKYQAAISENLLQQPIEVLRDYIIAKAQRASTLVAKATGEQP